jgi:DNA-binding LacI/PurR family transcriptional regulator
MTAHSDSGDARPRPASVFDVARAAGVSHQTVSRVLNDHPSLRDATRQKVLQAMRELNYRPNAAARALSSSRSRMIGILSTASGEYGPASSVAAVETAARARGYSVTIANADGLDPSSVNEAVNHLANLSAEGLVVVAPQTRVLAALSALSIGIPFVTRQSTGTGVPGARQLDQVVGARLATAHLVDLGHRRIGHIAGPGEWLDASQRLAGFRDELNRHGLDASHVAPGDWSATSGHRAALELLDAGVTALFVGNDQMALGALSAATQRGLRVPEDLSVVGFDDVPEAAYYHPSLTTVRQDLAEAGRRAVALLLGESDAAPSVHPELIVRASTAKPRR